MKKQSTDIERLSKKLTQLNEDYKSCIRDLDAECVVAEMEVKGIISNLIGKKVM